MDARTPPLVELVEPDPNLSRALAYVLECQGYRVRLAGGVEEARVHLALSAAIDTPPGWRPTDPIDTPPGWRPTDPIDTPPGWRPTDPIDTPPGWRPTDPIDLLLTEVVLPDGRGFDLCREVRAHDSTKHAFVVFLSQTAAEVDRILAFEMGADDFVSKPFSMRELILRLRALQRRTPRARAAGGPLSDGRVFLDADQHRLQIDGRAAHTTRLETRLLGVLLAQPHRVFSREELLVSVWGQDVHRDARTVDCTVRRLRAKLGHAGAALKTVRGVGFAWRGVGLDRR